MKIRMNSLLMLGAFLAMTLPLATAMAKTESKVSEQEAYEIGIEAYAYLHPIITMDITRTVLTNIPSSANAGAGPVNRFNHARAFPEADFREVVRPNFDTLYSSAWIDLNQGPVVISVPDTKGRYYVLPLMDMWTDVFADLGKRTTGTKAGNFVLVPLGYDGETPPEMRKIVAPTSSVWIIGRIQTNGPKDYPFVHGLQAGLKITPLAEWGNSSYEHPAQKIDTSVDVKTAPFDQVVNMPADKYFAYGAKLMKKYPPHLTDVGMVARLERIGIVVGEDYDLNRQPAYIQTALKRASKDALELMKGNIPNLGRVRNNWTVSTDTMGVYGNAYMKRAVVTLIGLGAIPPEDAIYPVANADKDGNRILGEHNYVIHFDKDKLPPVDAFWSITMYDEKGFQVANKLNRFAIGDRDDLTFNKDGSLDIYIQHGSPGTNKESNWLPSPEKGVLGITMRLYQPKAEVLDGRWAPPYIERVE